MSRGPRTASKLARPLVLLAALAFAQNYGYAQGAGNLARCAARDVDDRFVCPGGAQVLHGLG